ncbi:uncharacterized protein CC84DRAFT_1232423 [Paraphaeosphaeria sporulosa]|uniref:Chromo domain-containing protein n=1 Tax=Paraphaeosphaeria sporulosa TaxID=1460663 RepID=A0A177BY05_9PLEO|nr:uncharacterized protein CC84DRAFT_1232423 [Paraphaeosphaeria sporulosa]OAF99830.1 hypothetical protein CC84DRAFT_1232423 [Paraphaeosphaeria sporulosa]
MSVISLSASASLASSVDGRRSSPATSPTVPAQEGLHDIDPVPGLNSAASDPALALVTDEHPSACTNTAGDNPPVPTPSFQNTGAALQELASPSSLSCTAHSPSGSVPKLDRDLGSPLDTMSDQRTPETTPPGLPAEKKDSKKRKRGEDKNAEGSEVGHSRPLRSLRPRLHPLLAPLVAAPTHPVDARTGSAAKEPDSNPQPSNSTIEWEVEELTGKWYEDRKRIDPETGLLGFLFFEVKWITGEVTWQAYTDLNCGELLAELYQRKADLPQRHFIQNLIEKSRE